MGWGREERGKEGDEVGHSSSYIHELDPVRVRDRGLGTGCST